VSRGKRLLEFDRDLSFRLQGHNRFLFPDLALESLALITPLIETGSIFRFYRAGYRTEGRTLALSLVTTAMTVGGLKYIVRRNRPKRRYQPRLWNTRITPSFPSGHVASFTAFTLIMGIYYPETKPLLTGIAVLTGYSQIFVGNHYISDVLAGGMIGYLVARSVHDITNKKVARFEKSSPSFTLKINVLL